MFFLSVLIINFSYSMDNSFPQRENETGENDTRDDRGRTPLMRAARRGSLAKIGPLISGGASVNFQDKDGMTALMHTIAHPLEGTIRYVISELLVCNGIDLLIKDNQGLNALAIVKQQEKKWIYSKYIYRQIGRMLLTHLRLYSAHGRVAKKGLQAKLPLDVLKYIATHIDYKQAATGFKS